MAASSLIRFRNCLPITIISGLRFLSVSSHAKRVGTHNDTFHCDEALGCFLMTLTSKFHGAQIIRTRNLQVLDTLDAVLDVGGVYDPSRDRFDHHQKGFDEILGDGFTTKLSSAGLVYKHYGAEIIAKAVKLDEKHPDVHTLYRAVYKNFIEAVDAVDNGISRYETDQPPNYVNNTSLSSRVSRMNINWYDDDQSPEKEDQAFHQAMKLAGDEFMDCISFHAKSWLPGRSVVMECLAERKNVDSSGEIMLLTRSCPLGYEHQMCRTDLKDQMQLILHTLSAINYGLHIHNSAKHTIIHQHNLTWKLHIFDLEAEMKIDPVLKYVIYQDDRNDKWRVQAVAVSPDKFKSRKALPSHWRGLTDDHLSQVAGISGCVFVHSSGFIGGNKTYEGALAMARASLSA